MNKKNFLSGIIAMFVTLSLFAGCATTAPQPEKPADEVVNEGMAALAGVTSYKYDLAVNGDITNPDTGNVKFNVKMSGAIDDKDMKDPRISINFEGSASDAEGSSASAKAELMMNKDAVYFNLKSLDLGEEELLPPDVQEYFGKWWMISLPPEVLDEMAEADTESDAEVEALKKELADAKVFATPEYVGSDSVMGEESHHYKVNIDKKALLAFIKKMAEKQGESISASEMKEAEEAFEKFDIVGDVWVGSISGILNRVKGTLILKDESEGSGTVAFDISLGDFDKPVTLNVPSGAEEFPVEELLGPLMMMGAMGDPSMMTDEDMVFDEAMFDESEFDEAEFEELMRDLEELEGTTGSGLISPEDYPEPIEMDLGEDVKTMKDIM